MVTRAVAWGEQVDLDECLNNQFVSHSLPVAGRHEQERGNRPGGVSDNNGGWSHGEDCRQQTAETGGTSH